MTEQDVLLDEARSSYRRREWRQARDRLSELDEHGLLDAADLERLASAAYLSGQEAGWEDAMSRAFAGFLAAGDPGRAARCAFWLGLTLVVAGEESRGGGWLARAGRVVQERLGEDCAAAGYLLAAAGYQELAGAQVEAARGSFDRATRMGRRFAEPDLVALGLLGSAQACVAAGRPGEAVRLLDEVLVDVETGEVSTIAAGLVYCAGIQSCHELFDLRRAQRWTATLSDWCAAQPELAPFAGQCLVHRSQLAQLRGDWDEAVAEAERACRRLAQDRTTQGMAFYQRGELHRLRGELAEAEAAYAEAARRGRSPHPGLALLRLAQGQHATAVAGIRLAEVRVGEAPGRAEVLGARVEIMLAAGELDDARTCVAELTELAGGPEGSSVHPVAASAGGALLLAEHQEEAALPVLRDARRAWRELRAPYQEARALALVARCLAALGDHDTARLEARTARETLASLGARPDLQGSTGLTGLAGLAGTGPAADASELTPGEIRVVRLVAAGLTNKQVAERLVISEKTVARHVHNILTKCRLPNRAAATAYAYEHGLV